MGIRVVARIYRNYSSNMQGDCLLISIVTSLFFKHIDVRIIVYCSQLTLEMNYLLSYVQTYPESLY